MSDPIWTMTLYVAAVIARFFTSKVFSLIHDETIGWKYGSEKGIQSVSA